VSEVLYVSSKIAQNVLVLPFLVGSQVFTIFNGGLGVSDGWLRNNLPDSARRKKNFFGDSLFGLSRVTKFFAGGRRLVRD